MTTPATDPAYRWPGELDEPVRRYLHHALDDVADGGPDGMRITMRGRVHVGMWLPFDAVWEGDGRSFRWSADAGPWGLLRVVDQFAAGTGSVGVRLLGRFSLLHAEDADVARSGAGRAAAEAIWAPAALLPSRGVQWAALRDDLIVATWDVPPERPQLRLRIDADGGVRSAVVMRWDARGRGSGGYVPCGCDVLEERTFDGITMPSRVSVGWGYGTPRFKPFFEAEITGARRVGVAPSDRAS